MNKFIETFESYPNSQIAMMDLIEMLEEYRLTLYGVPLSRESLKRIRHELHNRGVILA